MATGVYEAYKRKMAEFAIESSPAISVQLPKNMEAGTVERVEVSVRLVMTDGRVLDFEDVRDLP